MGSQVSSYPGVGYAADLLVRAGATVLFSEITEVRDAVHLLTPRCINEQVALDLIHEMKWYDEYRSRATDFIRGPQQLASMTMRVFTSGQRSPYGLVLVPVVKVSSRSALAERWHDLIDVDAGRIATGEGTIEQAGAESFRFILYVASGLKKTWTDHRGLHNAPAPFNPDPIT